MSSGVSSNAKKSSYIAEFFKKGLIIPTLFIVALFITLIAVSYEFDFTSQISSDNSKYLSMIIPTFCIALMLLFSAVKIKQNFVHFNDCLNFGMILFGIFYALFYYFAEGFDSFGLEKIIITFSSIFAGVVISILRSLYVGEEPDSEYVMNIVEPAPKKERKGIIKYLATVFEKYNYLTIIAGTVIINSLFFFVLSLNFDFVEELKILGVNEADDFFFKYLKDFCSSVAFLKILLILGAISLFVYSLIALFDKKVNGLDLFLSSFLLSIPINLCVAYFIGNDNANYVTVIVSSVIAIIFLIVRSFFYDKPVDLIKERGVFSSVILSKDIFFTLGIGVSITVLLNIFFKAGLTDIIYSNEEFYVFAEMMPFIVLFLTCILGIIILIVNLVMTISVSRFDTVQKCDKYLFANIFAALSEIFILLIVNKEYSVVYLISLFTFIFISLCMLIFRYLSVKYQ